MHMPGQDGFHQRLTPRSLDKFTLAHAHVIVELRALKRHVTDRDNRASSQNCPLEGCCRFPRNRSGSIVKHKETHALDFTNGSGNAVRKHLLERRGKRRDANDANDSAQTHRIHTPLTQQQYQPALLWNILIASDGDSPTRETWLVREVDI